MLSSRQKISLKLKKFQTIWFIEGDPDERVDPEELQLHVRSLEGFPVSIHQLLNPDAVDLQIYKQDNMLLLHATYSCNIDSERVHLL